MISKAKPTEWEAEDWRVICVDDVNEVGVARVESGHRVSVVEVGLGGVQAGDSGQRESVGFLEVGPRVAKHMRPEAVAEQVEGGERDVGELLLRDGRGSASGTLHGMASLKSILLREKNTCSFPLSTFHKETILRAKLLTLNR